MRLKGSTEKVVAAEEDSEAKKPTELIDDILKVSIMIFVYASIVDSIQ